MTDDDISIETIEDPETGEGQGFRVKGPTWWIKRVRREAERQGTTPEALLLDTIDNAFEELDRESQARKRLADEGWPE